MLRIRTRSPEYSGRIFDYELEDGTLLDSSDWNGSSYIVGHSIYAPVYMYQAEEIDLNSIEPDTPIWDDVTQIIWFEKQ